VTAAAIADAGAAGEGATGAVAVGVAGVGGGVASAGAATGAVAGDASVTMAGAVAGIVVPIAIPVVGEPGLVGAAMGPAVCVDAQELRPSNPNGNANCVASARATARRSPWFSVFSVFLPNSEIKAAGSGSFRFVRAEGWTIEACLPKRLKNTAFLQ
jgi:hypothetical protein